MLVAAWILAAGTAAATKAKPVATPAPAPGAPVEVVLSEASIEALLRAAAPFDETMEQEVGALGITKTVQVKVHLENPRVHVATDGVHVTLDYHLVDDSGVVDTTGTATPILTITPLPSKSTLEGRLAHSGISLMGVEVPLESLVDPIEIPAAIDQDVDLGEKKAVAKFRAAEVVNEDGRVRVRGTVSFSPAKR